MASPPTRTHPSDESGASSLMVGRKGASLSLRDGLYRVETERVVAGFVVERGRVVRCAPILRRRFSYWITKATWLGP